MIDRNLERLRTHSANIRRYRKLLESHLTEVERAYIERRLNEQHAFTEALLKKMLPDRLSALTAETGLDRRTTSLDMTALLHPAEAFSHPMDVVEDGDLTSYEKRAILSSWAADACAAKGGPELTHALDAGVSFDDILDALRILDSDPKREADFHGKAGPQTGSHSSEYNPDLDERTDRC